METQKRAQLAAYAASLGLKGLMRTRKGRKALEKELDHLLFLAEELGDGDAAVGYHFGGLTPFEEEARRNLEALAWEETP